MTTKQYCQLLQNRRRKRLAPLFGGREEVKLLRSAARSTRQHARAVRALAQVLPAEWLEVTHVQGVEGGALVVSVTDPVVRQQLRRQSGRVQKQLARCMAGVRRLCVT